VRWLALVALLAVPASAQTLLRIERGPEFPAGFEVYGSGADASGGYGKPDCEVTSLSNSGATTLRGIQATSCCTADNGCNVTFDPTLNATSTLTSDIVWTQDNSTIDCQAAGVTNEGFIFRDFGLRVFADNVVVRNCRFRGTSQTGCAGSFCESDCFTLSGQNIVLDHVSGLWCSDEIVNVSNHPDITHGPVRNITVQHSIFGEPSDQTTPNATRLTLVGDGVEGPVTFYRNVFKSSTDRAGVKCGTDGAATMQCEMVENVVYDFVYAARSYADAGEVLRYDFLRNVFKRGPSRVGEDVTAVEKLPIWTHADNGGLFYVFGEGNVLLDNGAPGQSWADVVSGLTGADCDAITDTEGGDPCDMPTTDCTVEPCAEMVDDPWRPSLVPFGALAASGDSILRQVISEAGPRCLETAEARALSNVRNGTRSLPFPVTTGDFPTLSGSCQ
jgi:hypothetical protein